MAVPVFNEHGLLPEGIYDCTLSEVEARFSNFDGTDRRPNLWGKFKEFLREAKTSGLLAAILVDGSFVTAKPNPNDIDLVLIVPAKHDFSAELGITHYNLLSQQRVRRRFGFDIVVVESESTKLEEAIDFFQQVRQRPGIKKGILRILL